MKRRSANPDYGDCSNNYLGNKYMSSTFNINIPHQCCV